MAGSATRPPAVAVSPGNAHVLRLSSPAGCAGDSRRRLLSGGRIWATVSPMSRVLQRGQLRASSAARSAVPRSAGRNQHEQPEAMSQWASDVGSALRTVLQHPGTPPTPLDDVQRRAVTGGVIDSIEPTSTNITVPKHTGRSRCQAPARQQQLRREDPQDDSARRVHDHADQQQRARRSAAISQPRMRRGSDASGPARLRWTQFGERDRNARHHGHAAAPLQEHHDAGRAGAALH